MSQHKQPRTKEQLIAENEAEIKKATAGAKIPVRRVRMLMVNPADFMFLFTKGMLYRKTTRIIEGVPDDARLIAVTADSARNGIMLVVESAEYDEIPINVLPPVQPVSINVGDKSATKKKKAARKKR